MSARRVVVVLLVLVAHVFAATIFRTQRSVSDADSKGLCQGSTPCGWAIYERFSRQIDFFMQNTCLCPEDKNCIRTDDDLSVSAYVYRCMKRES